MRTQALLLAALVAAAVAAPQVSRAQAAPRVLRDDKPPKPKPKPHKSDDDGPDNHSRAGSTGSELANQSQTIAAIREDLTMGRLVSVAGAPICQEAQSELLGLLTNSDAKPSSASCVVTATVDSRANPALRPQLLASAAGILDKGNSAIAGPAPVTTSPLSVEGATNAASRRAMILSNFTAAGAPSDKASALLSSLTGILSRPRDHQLTESIDGFNRLVAAAPDDFLKNPPTYFLAVHAVLARLVGTASK